MMSGGQIQVGGRSLDDTTDGLPAVDDATPVWGGCGVEDCRDCFPLYNEANEPITDNFGRPL